MRERPAQSILLIRAFEEIDADGLILSHRDRAQATRRALMVTGLGGDPGLRDRAWEIRSGEAVMRRARLLSDALRRSCPSAQHIVHVARLGASTGPTLIAVGLLIGLLTNVLGFERKINLLSVPLIGLLAWNVVVYLLLAVSALRGRRPGRSRGARFLSDQLFRGALRRRLRSARLFEGDPALESRVLVKVVTRFAALWHRLAGDLLESRAKRLFHLGALSVMAGALFGMYLRGIAFEYRVTWESTWFDAGQVRWLLGVLLGPAAALIGVELPDVAPLQGPAGGGDAALWIHLYAITALLWVILPRAGLALYEAWWGSRLARDLPLDLDEPYFRRMFSAWRGSTRRVLILPYSHRPAPASVASLKTLLFEFFGARADLQLLDPVPYGADFDELPSALSELTVPDDEDRESELKICVVFLFSAAQSPESEVHARLLAELLPRLDPDSDQLLVVLDSSGYRDQIGDPARLQEREQAWKRVLDEADLTPVLMELEPTSKPDRLVMGDAARQELLVSIASALWPAPEHPTVP